MISHYKIDYEGMQISKINYEYGNDQIVLSTNNGNAFNEDYKEFDYMLDFKIIKIKDYMI
jgi:hypothetical protein